MKKTYNYVFTGLNFLFFILAFLIFKIEDVIAFSITAFIQINIEFWDYYLIKKKIKSGKYRLVGKGERNKFEFLFPTLIFVFLILLECIYSFKDSFWNISPVIYFMLLILLFRYIFDVYNYLLILKENTIMINDKSGKEEWRYSKLDKVVINQNKLHFFKKNDELTITLDNEEELNVAKQFLSVKLKERLIIEA